MRKSAQVKQVHAPGMLFSSKQTQTHVIHMKMNGTEDHPAKQNELNSKSNNTFSFLICGILVSFAIVVIHSTHQLKEDRFNLPFGF